MIYTIEAYNGVDSLHFGMDKASVHIAMGVAEPYTFRRGKFSKGDTEKYGDCFINYDSDDKCASIEFFGMPTLMFDNVNLFSLTSKEIRCKLTEGSLSVVDNDCGFTSFEYGIGVYMPYIDEDDTIPESIIVFKRGYYD